MSKHKGNVVNPFDMMNQYGADSAPLVHGLDLKPVAADQV